MQDIAASHAADGTEGEGEATLLALPATAGSRAARVAPGRDPAQRSEVQKANVASARARADSSALSSRVASVIPL